MHFHGPTPRTVRRHFCKSCGKTFTPFIYISTRYKYTNDLLFEAGRLYFDQKGSSRSVSRILSQRSKVSINHRRVLSFLHELGQNCKDTQEVATELSPKWCGYVGVDGKTIWIKGKEHQFFLAVDLATRDIVHFTIMEAETVESISHFFLELVTKVRYPLAGFVADLEPAFIGVHENYFAKIPYQVCVVHLEEKLNRLFVKRKRTFLEQEFANLYRSVIYAETKQSAWKHLEEIKTRASEFKGAKYASLIRSLIRHFSRYTAHFAHPGLSRDNNICENVIGQLGIKLDLMRRFESDETAYGYLKLLVMWYRFKRFSSSRTKENNGKSPLELAGVNIGDLDWIRYCQRSE